ncbi:hypothetical protein KM043_002436 [Ampulex compressa]|nr:hypothetical protein KM043_002436 [Ampulex compressa]
MFMFWSKRTVLTRRLLKAKVRGEHETECETQEDSSRIHRANNTSGIDSDTSNVTATTGRTSRGASSGGAGGGGGARTSASRLHQGCCGGDQNHDEDENPGRLMRCKELLKSLKENQLEMLLTAVESCGADLGSCVLVPRLNPEDSHDTDQQQLQQQQQQQQQQQYHHSTLEDEELQQYSTEESASPMRPENCRVPIRGAPENAPVDPHLLCCQIWRWPDLTHSSELKRLPVCHSAKDPVYICCNPYHWSRLCKPESPPPPYCLIADRLRPEDFRVSLFQWSLQTCVQTPIHQVAVGRSEDAFLANAKATGYRIPELEGDAREGKIQQRSIPKAAPHCYEAIKISAGNNRRNNGHMAAFGAGRGEERVGGPVTRDNLRACTVGPSAEPKDRAPSEGDQRWCKNSTPLPLPGSLTTNGEGETEQKEWCTLAYWELGGRVGRLYPVEPSTVNVFDSLHDGDGLCLATLAENHAASPAVQRTRSKIGLGLMLSQETDGVWAYNRSESPIFVNSPTLDDPESRTLLVYRVPPGFCLNIFDRTKVLQAPYGSSGARTGSQSSTFASGPVDINSVRISFAKGWGPKYSRQEVTSCPCWLEVLLAPCSDDDDDDDDDDDIDVLLRPDRHRRTLEECGSASLAPADSPKLPSCVAVRCEQEPGGNAAEGASTFGRRNEERYESRAWYSIRG